MITLVDNKIYLLKGGAIVQYKAGLSMGYGPVQVLREITSEDARVLRMRWVQLKMKRMNEEAAWIQHVADLVGVQLPRIPTQITERWGWAA